MIWENSPLATAISFGVPALYGRRQSRAGEIATPVLETGMVVSMEPDQIPKQKGQALPEHDIMVIHRKSNRTSGSIRPNM